MARICIISEGSYPYVVGGVSSWIHDLITVNSKDEFVLVSIIPNKKFAVDKYKLPKNVVEVKNIVLNPSIEISGAQVLKNNTLGKKNIKLDKIEEKIMKVLDFKNLDVTENLKIIEELVSGKMGNPMELLASKVYWNALEKHYKNNFKNTNFNTFYWTHRNIMVNLFQLMKEELPEADIYHSVATGYAGFIASLINYKKMGKVILTEHGIYPREREEEIISASWVEEEFKEIWVEFFYYLSKLSYHHADEIVTLFNYNKQLQIECGADAKKCSVISNGVDVNRFKNIKRKSKEEFSVGAVLRVVPIKDVKMMLKSIKIAKQKMGATKFYLIGPTDENKQYYKECLQVVKDFEMESYVFFTGKVNVDEYYEFLDLMMLTSISEGQPLSVLEGLATGIPFIATDVGNCREILLEKKEIGEAGVIVAPTSYIEFSEELVKLYQNQDRLKEMGANGKKIVTKYYKREKFINAYKDMYERLGE